MANLDWHSTSTIAPKEYTCGFCGRSVASVIAYTAQRSPADRIYICPNCNRPTYFSSNGQLPGVAPGAEVDKLPADVDALYREARNCVAASCYTAAVLIARKLLMSIAVAQGAAAGEQFIKYVDHLATTGFIPPNGRGWVDHIRKKGNEANHEIMLMSQTDAEELISFIEMLLKFIYEFPGRIPAKT